jgi:hypothetical protein
MWKRTRLEWQGMRMPAVQLTELLEKLSELNPDTPW